MFIGRKNTLFDRFADYYLSLKPLELIKYEAYTEPEHTIYDDWKLRDDVLIVRKEDIERTFGIKLNSLEQIEL